MSGPNPQLVALGKAVRALREEHGLSTADLAARARVDAAALEAGQLDPDFDSLLRVARALDTAGGTVLDRGGRGRGAPPSAPAKVIPLRRRAA